MIEQLPVWIKLADELRKSLNSGQDFEKLLPPNAILLLKRFREAYQAKDAAKVGEQLSAEYSGTLYNAHTREEFVERLKETFRQAPRGLSPNLHVTVFQVVERDEPGVFEAVLEFHARFAVLGIPLREIGSGKVSCEARAEMPFGIWRLVRMDSVK
jgi:hypothetical protein